jgi:membrane protein DedA with SNARE-associated domain
LTAPTPTVAGIAIDPAIMEFVRQYQHLAEPLVFVLGVAEGIPVVSVFVPSTPIFIGVSSVHAAAGGAFGTVWISASIGAFLGDFATYCFGRYFKDRAAKVWPLKKHPEWLARGHDLFERWGVLAIFGGKFLGVLRPILPLVAGIVRMPFPMFLVASAVSSMMWAGVFLSPGFGIGQAVR